MKPGPRCGYTLQVPSLHRAVYYGHVTSTSTTSTESHRVHRRQILAPLQARPRAASRTIVLVLVGPRSGRTSFPFSHALCARHMRARRRDNDERKVHLDSLPCGESAREDARAFRSLRAEPMNRLRSRQPRHPIRQTHSKRVEQNVMALPSPPLSARETMQRARRGRLQPRREHQAAEPHH